MIINIFKSASAQMNKCSWPHVSIITWSLKIIWNMMKTGKKRAYFYFREILLG